jgi:O-antigen/teichoic acid export membrane protein
VWSRSEMVFLKWYSTVEQIAYFSVAFSLSVLPGQLVSPFSLAAMTSLYAERGRDAKAGVRVSHAYWRYLVLLVLPASLGLAVLSGPLLRVLYGPRYFDAVPVLMIAGALSVFATLGQPATVLATAAGGQRRLVVVGILSAIATLLLDFFLVRAFAANGGALANGIGQAISTVTVILVARRFGFSPSYGLLLRVTVAALGMTAAVGVLVRFAPDLVGIVAGPLVGALAYVLLLRLLKIIDEEDVSRFTSALGILPGRLRPPFQKMLHFLAPTAK